MIWIILSFNPSASESSIILLFTYNRKEYVKDMRYKLFSMENPENIQSFCLYKNKTF